MFVHKLKSALAETIHDELTARLDRANMQARARGLHGQGG
jgi:hypothetical protein